MQNRAFEKCVWAATLIFCAVMISPAAASAGTPETLVSAAQNPFLYAAGLAAAFIGAKAAGSAKGQF